MTNERKQVTIYTDASGGQEHERSAGAFIILFDGRQICRSFVLPEAQSTLAKFNAVKGAIAELHDNNIRGVDLTVFTDFEGMGKLYERCKAGNNQMKSYLFDVINSVLEMLNEIDATAQFKHIRGHVPGGKIEPGSDAYFFAIVDQASRKTRKTGEEFYHVG